MQKCKMGYEVQDNLIPPERCHCYDENFGTYESCKDCYEYNRTYELVEKAINFIKYKKYKLKQNRSDTLTFSKELGIQEELIDIIIEALEFYRDEGE